MKLGNAPVSESRRSWDTVKAAFEAALALEQQFDEIYVAPTVVTTERGPERSAQCNAVPRWVWEASERLTDARCDAEEALIFFPAPDLAGALWKIEYARPRWEAMEDWPECWWSAVLADLRRFVADPHMAWLSERDALLREYNAAADAFTNEAKLLEAAQAIEQRIHATPATSRDGLLAKLLLVVADGALALDDTAIAAFNEAKALGLIEHLS